MTVAPLTVTVTGAAGQIAYSLLPLLCSGQVFGPSQPIDLHLLEIPPALKTLSGVVLELEDSFFPLLSSVLLTSDPLLGFENADVAILVGAYPRRQGMERKDLLGRNVGIFKEQGIAIGKVAKKGVKVVVVGNPANTNALVVARYAGISGRNVTALSRLDENRARGIVGRELGVGVGKVDGVVVWGNHSGTMFPDFMRGLVGGKGILKGLGGLEGIRKLIGEVQKRGGVVIEKRGTSSAMSAARAIGMHVGDWICGSGDRVVSMGVLSEDGLYGVEDGVWCSFPVRCVGGGEYQVVKEIELDEFSRECVEISVRELYAEKAEAEEFL